LGATVSNTDKTIGLYTGLNGMPAVAETNVELVQTSPANTGLEVEGVSCKNKLWEPAPTKEAAIQVAKLEAAKAGYTKLRVTSVKKGGNVIDLRRNCWSVILAKGIAFN
tara:strand:+ start:349 stop:675 length:327 start_codon:yes stop_codon:yes gene_type:complete